MKLTRIAVIGLLAGGSFAAAAQAASGGASKFGPVSFQWRTALRSAPILGGFGAHPLSFAPVVAVLEKRGLTPGSLPLADADLIVAVVRDARLDVLSCVHKASFAVKKIDQLVKTSGSLNDEMGRELSAAESDLRQARHYFARYLEPGELRAVKASHDFAQTLLAADTVKKAGKIAEELGTSPALETVPSAGSAGTAAQGRKDIVLAASGRSRKKIIEASITSPYYGGMVFPALINERLSSGNNHVQYVHDKPVLFLDLQKFRGKGFDIVIPAGKLAFDSILIRTKGAYRIGKGVSGYEEKNYHVIRFDRALDSQSMLPPETILSAMIAPPWGHFGSDRLVIESRTRALVALDMTQYGKGHRSFVFKKPQAPLDPSLDPLVSDPANQIFAFETTDLEPADWAEDMVRGLEAEERRSWLWSTVLKNKPSR